MKDIGQPPTQTRIMVSPASRSHIAINRIHFLTCGGTRKSKSSLKRYIRDAENDLQRKEQRADAHREPVCARA